MSNVDKKNLHALFDEWKMYSHYSNEKDWSLESYIELYRIHTIEDMICLNQYINNEVITSCMLFLMRGHINPMWEDENNKYGGCFSYKLDNKIVEEIWKRLCFFLICENISDNLDFVSKVNGITISPKKNFCILKIWMKDCSYTTTYNIDRFIHKEIANIKCIFKKHVS